MAAVATALEPVRPPAPALEAMIRSLTLPDVGSDTLRTAIRAWGTPEAAYERLAAGARRRLDRRELDRSAGRAAAALRTIRELDVHVVTETMPGYPRAFRHVTNRPFLFFARGRLELLETPMVAIVGTRRCTDGGRDVAGRMARGLAAAGVTVVSGLALGIDGAAHAGAGPARTVGILGCGIDVDYPREHRRLQARIGREGLVLTELLPGAPPEGHNFPRRNRLIAALGRGVVVIEAPFKSGAMHTMREALSLGRALFAVPGPVSDRRSEGPNQMIRDGAALVTRAREVLVELGLPLPPEGSDADEAPAELEGVGLALWEALGAGARHADELADAMGLPTHQGLASLLSLEIQGHVRQLPGLRFARA